MTIRWVGPELDLAANIFGITPSPAELAAEMMPATTLDIRDVPPPERHPQIHEAFDALERGETLRIINDHDPQPLFYEFQAEVDAFDADGYTVERHGDQKFVADLPKR